MEFTTYDEYDDIDAGRFVTLLPAVDLALWVRLVMLALLIAVTLGLTLSLA